MVRRPGYVPRSSRGLGRWPLTPVTRVRIPYAVPRTAPARAGAVRVSRSRRCFPATGRPSPRSTPRASPRAMRRSRPRCLPTRPGMPRASRSPPRRTRERRRRRLGGARPRLPPRRLPRRRGGDDLRRRAGARPGHRRRAPAGTDRSGRARRHLDAPGEHLPRERGQHRAARALRLPRRRHARAAWEARRDVARRRPDGAPERGRRVSEVRRALAWSAASSPTPAFA